MIPKPQLGEIYARALQSYNREAKDGEFDAWLNVLGGFSYSDLDAALRRWQSDTVVEEFTQRPRGARMPTSAELRLSIQQFERTLDGKFSACGKGGCMDGWVKTSSGPDPKAFTVRRCACFWAWARTRKVTA